MQFTFTDTRHLVPQKVEDFFHIEVYRHLPLKARFKQKVQGYVSTGDTGQHQALFGTPALSIAVIASASQMAATLKHWTEEALGEMARPEEGVRFFFRSIADTGKAHPTKLYLAPVWQQAFGMTKTPLLILDADDPWETP